MTVFGKKRLPNSSVVGLELDPSHLAAAEVSVNGTLKLTGGAYADLRPGVMRDGEDVFEGGASINSIPTLARAKIDIRSESNGKMDDLVEILTASVERAQSVDYAQCSGWNRSKSGPAQGPTHDGGGAQPGGGYQPAGGVQSGGGTQPASSVAASVASSGFAEAAGIPNNAQGFAWALLKLRDSYAPNVVLAIHASAWGNGRDIAMWVHMDILFQASRSLIAIYAKTPSAAPRCANKEKSSS